MTGFFPWGLAFGGGGDALVRPQITTNATLTGGTEMVAYSQQLAATGSGPITYAVTAGALPTGVTLSAAGLLSGTPTDIGVFSVTIRATGPGGFDDETFSLTIGVAAFTAYKLTSGNVTVTDTNLVNVKAFPADASSTYEVVVIGRFTAASDATGAKMGFSVPAGAAWTFGGRLGSSGGAGGAPGDGYVRGSDATAQVVSVAGLGTAGAGSSLYAAAQVTTGVTAGDVTFQVASEDTNDLTVLNGLVVLARKVGTRLKRVTGSDATQSSNVTYTNLFTWALQANRDYWIDVVLDYAAAASTTGIRPAVDLPSGCTVLAAFIGRTSTAAEVAVVRAAATDAAFANNQGATKSPLIVRMLLRNGSTAGDAVLKFRSEVNASTVTVYQGSFGVLRDVTGVVTELSGDVSETTTTPENVFALAIEASKNYLFRFGGGFSTATTAYSHRVDAPALSTFVGLFTAQGAASTDTAGNAARTSNAVSTPPNSDTGVESPYVGDVWIENSTNAGNVVYAIASDGSGTVTAESGGFGMVEEVTLAP